MSSFTLFQETWFYVPDLGERPLPPPAHLPEDEAHHAFAVLRLKEGATIFAADGRGSVYAATLSGNRQQATITPVQCLKHDPQAPRAALGMTLLKGRDCEDPVAAACELPLSDIYLLRTEHAQVFSGQDHEKLVSRLRQKSIVALKQAKKTYLSRVHAPMTLSELRKTHPDLALVTAQPGEDNYPQNPPQHFALLIGPEGGFSQGEIAWLAEQPQSYRMGLGPTRLRAVHAPLVGLGKLLGRGWLS